MLVTVALSMNEMNICSLLTKARASLEQTYAYSLVATILNSNKTKDWGLV